MNIHLFQICPDGGDAGDAGFTPLANPASDTWGDFAAIRGFFHAQAVDEEHWYAFVPRDFIAQTGLNAAHLIELAQAAPGCDAYTFSPHTVDAAGNLNLLLQGERQLPGLAGTTRAFLENVGLALDPEHFVPPWQSNVLNGFVLAKPVFWRTWFDLAERLHQLADQEPGPLADQLNSVAPASRTTSAKRLLGERLASLVLALDQQLTIWHCPPARMPGAQQLASQDLAALEALRAAYAQYNDPLVRSRFDALAARLLREMDAAPVRPPSAVAAEQRPLSISSAAAAISSSGLRLGGISPVAATDAAAQAARGELVFGCMTHVPLPVKFPDHVLPIYLGESQHDGALNLRDLAPEWVPYHPIVGGMLGNFALRNLILREYPKAQRVGVCMYRKFVSRERISGVPADDNWMMDVVSDREFASQSLEQMLEPGSQDFVVGRTCGFSYGGQGAGYLTHYAHAHHAEDLLRYAAAATELGVFGKAEAEAFFNEKVFFMGGVELGVFPAQFWLQAIGQIEAVTWYCVQRYDTRREGYQARAWAFCAERLGSYLLLRELRARYGEPAYQRFFGQLNLITKGDQKQYVPSH
ncbi:MULTISPECIES: hypothetical protein [unclassified Herbaspirillum]|uniref:hypothetical protein n=1 Tax=unclassified Herbaspirillum TaxID=2624150 RepID=UPI00115393A1|nr:MULTISPECIES: hypothetical protein [unclassified Herbaspirillum]MBB5390102.1 hypothetical protein [Herbaspirillum sp. SJZ102]TQK09399.1 hypothetical protein FB599_1764 [Herbaspirillum sp. SJZ130]TQK13914.1 hypothetical protein FB598_1278 [Herbaspirillum sp. SJZ106]TWC69638.1 hypothetical protein FB597_102241 [Herbaspirillum sp. SJZ099]